MAKYSLRDSTVNSVAFLTKLYMPTVAIYWFLSGAMSVVCRSMLIYVYLKPHCKLESQKWSFHSAYGEAESQKCLWTFPRQHSQSLSNLECEPGFWVQGQSFLPRLIVWQRTIVKLLNIFIFHVRKEGIKSSTPYKFGWYNFPSEGNDSSLGQAYSNHLSLLKQQCRPTCEKRAGKIRPKALDTDSCRDNLVWRVYENLRTIQVYSG